MVLYLKVEHEDFSDKSIERHCLEVRVWCYIRRWNMKTFVINPLRDSV